MPNDRLEHHSVTLKPRGSLLVWSGKDMYRYGTDTALLTEKWISAKYGESKIKFCITIKALFNPTLRLR